MNQILVTKIKNNSYKYIFKIQLLISLTIMIFLICILFNYFYLLKKKEQISLEIIGDYNIYKLYAQNSNDIVIKNDNNIFGIIEIPKINISYPIFSYLTDENLKISPCKFYGSTPKNNGNICIAGHNYNNSMFFSNIHNLNLNDEIFIFDNLNNKYVYKVFDIYEVNKSNLSPIFNFNKYNKELTLVTCNNFNKNRVILKAKQ